MQILFDIGGTNMRFATSQSIKEPIITNTPQNYPEALEKINEIYRSLSSSGVVGAAGGIAGPFNTQKTKLVNAPNLPKWIDKPIAEDLAKIFGCEVFLENDTGLVGLGEAVHGAGKDHKIVAFLGIGTGVGGARIVDGQIDESAFGFEPGHQIINQEEGELGSLESYVSGSGIELRTGSKPSSIKDPEYWKEVANQLAIGLHNIAVMWSPDVIVVGGGMIDSKIIPLELAIQKLKEIHTIFPELPQIKPAELDDSGGLLGAQEYFSQRRPTN